jgi:hypothetical protein
MHMIIAWSAFLLLLLGQSTQVTANLSSNPLVIIDMMREPLEAAHLKREEKTSFNTSQHPFKTYSVTCLLKIVDLESGTRWPAST